MERSVSVWYLTEHTACNFRCSYCASGTAQAVAHGEWATPSSLARHRRIVKWVTKLPLRVRVRMQSCGETFASRDLLADAARLTRCDHVEFVELLTNASLVRRRFADLADKGDPSKISLWATFHSEGWDSPERFFEQLDYARGHGAFVAVNALAFPHNLEEIDLLGRLCDQRGLPFGVDFGLNIMGVYPNLPLLPSLFCDLSSVARTIYHRGPELGHAVQLLACSSPAGLPCAAGHDYIKVGGDGGVWPCRRYEAFPDASLGNVLTTPTLVPKLRRAIYAPCRYPYGCFDKEEAYHLQMMHEVTRIERSLRWRVRKRGVSEAQMQCAQAQALFALARRMSLTGGYPVAHSLPNGLGEGFLDAVRAGAARGASAQQILDGVEDTHQIADRNRGLLLDMIEHLKAHAHKSSQEMTVLALQRIRSYVNRRRHPEKTKDPHRPRARRSK